MSWLFSQALVAEYSEATFLDGKPSSQLNVMPTQHKFWHNDKTMDASDLSRFGLTLRLLTEDLGGTVLTSYLAAFPARTSAVPAGVLASMESAADSGSTWRASFAKYDPSAESLWRTRQCSLLGDSDEYSETWPRWGSMLNGECLERTTPELHTSEKESGFWPTVRASDGERGGRGDLIQAIRGNTNSHFKMHPTPTASNTKAHHMRGSDKGKKREARSYGERGPLNPDWVEWLMGWPVKWTALEPLEMDKYHEWLRQHSPSSHAQAA